MKKIILALMAITVSGFAIAQESQSIDRVIAVVGGSITLQSELETQYLQMLSSGVHLHIDVLFLLLS